MTKETFASLEDYQDFITETIESWTPTQRTVLAAAMAERWLPVYDAFSKNEDWGDPELLRSCLDMVWGTLQAKNTASVDWIALENQVRRITPHLDDIDAHQAIAVCAIMQYAFHCCVEDENLTSALMAVLSGLEAARPDLLIVDRIPKRMWNQVAVHKEISKQLQLMEQINALEDIANAYATLKSFLTSPQMVGTRRSKKKSRKPAKRTNEDVFKQYCQIIRTDLRGKENVTELKKDPDVAAILNLSAWMSRYGRRKQILSGEYGLLADETAVSMLLARNEAKDRFVTTSPAWDASTRLMIDLCYQNRANGLDADSVAGTHKYGPSLRQLWADVKQRGLPDDEAWAFIVAWGHQLPNTKQTRIGNPALLKENLAQPLTWTTTEDLDTPWRVRVDNVSWEVRLNDFPDEVMYSLLIDGKVIGNFHNWPNVWIRESEI